MQELPRLSWGCVHKCSLCACLPSESKCASPSAHPCLWLSCGTAHVQVFCLWLHCWLQDHLKEGDGNVIEWFNWTAQWVLKVCQAWGLPLLKKWINSSTGEPQQKKPPSLCKYWQDYVAGNRHWDLEVAKQSAFEIYAVHGDYADVKCWHEQGLVSHIMATGFGSGCLGWSCCAM